MTVTQLRPPRPTWLYRIYCTHGGLLYVGISYDVQERLAQHRKTQPWWDDVANVIAYRYPSREQAREAELAAITYDAPQYNLEGVIPNDQYAANHWLREYVSGRSLPLWRWTSARQEATF